MSALILDGKTIANQLQHQLALSISRLEKLPCLAVILVGNDPASEIYVHNKEKACSKVGILSIIYRLNTAVDENELLTLINKLNNDKSISGILVQLPLPKTINSRNIIESINPDKDVDGFHPYNLGRLAQRMPVLRPCTSYGIIHLLKAYSIPIKGKSAVVIGASNIVGRPMALEFLMAGATVTICHSLTNGLEQYIKHADIIVSATGVYHLIKSSWLNKKQTIVDVGIHRDTQGKIHGDVNFKEAIEIVSAITPVPGGVGPMTIAMLLANTLQATGNKLVGLTLD